MKNTTKVRTESLTDIIGDDTLKTYQNMFVAVNLQLRRIVAVASSRTDLDEQVKYLKKKASRNLVIVDVDEWLQRCEEVKPGPLKGIPELPAGFNPTPVPSPDPEKFSSPHKQPPFQPYEGPEHDLVLDGGGAAWRSSRLSKLRMD